MILNILTSPSKQQILSLPSIKRFIKIYAKNDNWHEIDQKAGNLGYGWLHYALIRILRPKRILNIGSRYGYIPATCALACKHNKKGVVDFVDAGYDQSKIQDKKNNWGGVGFWTQKNAKNHFNKFELSDFIKLYVMTSENYSIKYSKYNWGYINIDGDHSYKGTKKNFNTFWPRLKKGGYICFHDIYIKKRDGTIYGVQKLWKELQSKNKYKMMELPGEFGLGIIQK